MNYNNNYECAKNNNEQCSAVKFTIESRELKN